MYRAIIFLAVFLCGNLAGSIMHAQESDRLTPEQYVELVSNLDFDAHTLTPAEFIARQSSENVVVFDLRSKRAFDQSHIKGAIHLGADFTRAEIQALVRDQNTTILLYCSNSLMPTRMISLTTISLPQLIAYGYENTFMLSDYFFGADVSEIPMTGNNADGL